MPLPELSDVRAGLQTRVETYRHFGYFAPEEVDDLKQMAATSDVTHPPALVRRFVELYADA